MQIIKETITEESQGLRVDLFLSQLTKETRETIKSQASFILVNHMAVKMSYRLKKGDIVEWKFSQTVLSTPTLIGEDIPLDIIFEDEHLMIINKARGMVVHPAKGNWSGTLSHALAFHLHLKENEELRPGIVHRLDKDTSGLMVIAKTSKAQKGLMQSFKERKVLKIYTALVEGILPSTYGMIDKPIWRSSKNRLLFCVDEIKGREAITEYQLLKEYKKASLIKVRIHTGRTHQIRVHFSSMGNAIIGDTLYSRWHKEPPLCLVASKIGFIHPITKEKMEFEIPLPKEIEEKVLSF